MHKMTRERSRLTQEAVAAMVPCSRTEICRIEGGKTPTPEMTVRLSEIYEAPEMMFYHCEGCAIGEKIHPYIEKQPLPNAVLQLNHAMNEADEQRLVLTRIARDGVITHDEITDAEASVKVVMNLWRASGEYLLAMYGSVDVPQLIANEKRAPAAKLNAL